MASTVVPENSTASSPWESVFDTEHIVLYITLSFFSVIGVIGNAIAFYIFFGRRNTGTSVTFILALAGTDFITCLVTIPYTIVFELLHYRLYYGGLCKMYMFLITSTIPYSSFIMAAIAFDRYFCICHPFLHVMNVQRARIIVLCLALPAFSFGIITGMFYGIFVLGTGVVCNGTIVEGTDITKDTFKHLYSNATYFLDLEEIKELPGMGFVKEVEYQLGNESHWVQTFQFIGECAPDKDASPEFLLWFQRIHSSCYLLSFTTVTVLYILIYKFIFERRAMKARRRKKNQYTSVANAETQALHPNAHPEPDTAMTEFNNTNGSLSAKGGSGGGAGGGGGGVGGDGGGGGGGNGDVGDDNNDGGDGDDGRGADTTANDNTATAAVAGTAGGLKAAFQEERKKSSDASTPLVVPQGGNGGGIGQGFSNKGGTKNTNGTTTENAVNESSRLPKRRGSTTRDRNLYANIKTAMMLFVVTLVFLVAFAPACLMTRELIAVQLNVFYMYFVYHVVNPFIYAFMNQSFREDLKKLLKRS